MLCAPLALKKKKKSFKNVQYSDDQLRGGK